MEKPLAETTTDASLKWVRVMAGEYVSWPPSGGRYEIWITAMGCERCKYEDRWMLRLSRGFRTWTDLGDYQTLADAKRAAQDHETGRA